MFGLWWCSSLPSYDALLRVRGASSWDGVWLYLLHILPRYTKSGVRFSVVLGTAHIGLVFLSVGAGKKANHGGANESKVPERMREKFSKCVALAR